VHVITAAAMSTRFPDMGFRRSRRIFSPRGIRQPSVAARAKPATRSPDSMLAMSRSKPNLEWIRTILGDLDDRAARAVDSSDTNACRLAAAPADPQSESGEPLSSNLKIIPE
jgi:hypothetical protein